MEEIWKDIPNYDGYQVSNLGRIRTHNKTTYTEMHKTRKWKDRILKQKKKKRKSGGIDCRVELWKDGKHKTFLVSRLVAFTFYNKDIKSKMTIDHIDGNPLNNRLDNLEIVTRKENIQRAFNNGMYHFCKKVKVTNKNTGKTEEFNSMIKASYFIEQNKGYISDKVNKGVFENKSYIWEII